MLRPATLLRFLIAITLPAALSAGEITVSPKGPVSTLQAARDAVRASRKAGQTGPAVIMVEAGQYNAATPLMLDAQDSDLTIRGAQGAKPLFLGGVVVKEFSPHSGQILKADVSALVKPGEKIRQLLFGTERMTLARYPNADAADPLYGGWAFVDTFPGGQAPEGHDWKSALYVKKQDLRQWAHPEDVELDIFAQYGWWNFIQPVKNLDPATRLLTLDKPCGYDLHPHNRFHFQNALEELDSPGEWFLDPRDRILYFWPPAEVKTKDVRLVTLDGFIQVKEGAKNVRIERLAFTGCAGTAVTLTRTERCLVAGCTFENVGGFNGSAVSLSGGGENEARSNDISFTGSTGINLSGGDRITLAGPGNRAVNNHIHHMGVFNKNACGVGATGVGHLVAHNLIHEGPRMGVQMSGNNIIIEYNHLHHLCLETQDGGAIYTGGRDWLGGRGCAWRYNRIHDVVGCGQEATGLKHPWFTFGLYPDDNTGGVDIIGNLVYRVAKSGIHLHNSRDCVVENNIFSGAGSYQIDLHGWRKEDHFYQSHIGTMIQGYDSVAGQPAWQKMRGMSLHPKDALRYDGTMMSGDVVQRNIMLADSPDAKYADLRNVSSNWNTIDNNLVWSTAGPVLTGQNKTGPDLGDPVLVETFDQTETGKLPKGWGFNSRVNNDVKLASVDGTLQADCLRGPDPKNSHTTFHGPDIRLKPGAAFRVRLRIQSSEPASSVQLSLAMYESGQGYWQSKSTPVTATPEWQEVETSATLPREDSAAWKPWMKAFWLRVDCQGDEGQIRIDNVRVSEAAPLNEWASWQAEGWDPHSLAADPLFENPAQDDFRLKPESPAFKLGFKALPIDQMGLVKDEWRTAL